MNMFSQQLDDRQLFDCASSPALLTDFGKQSARRLAQSRTLSRRIDAVRLLGLMAISVIFGSFRAVADEPLPFPLIERFESFSMEQGMPTHKVHCVLLASDGRLWVGTYKGALVRENGKFRRIGVEDG